MTMTFSMIRPAVAAAILASTAITSPSFATTFVGDYTITANSGDGLIVETTKVANIDGAGFSLNAIGATKSYNDFFEIRTTESTVNWTPGDNDDVIPRPISVAFNFTQPSNASGTVTGSTVGEIFLAGIYQDGLLTWDNGGTTIVDFGSIGRLQISLGDDVVFGSNFPFPTGGLTERVGKVGATFTLLAASPAVPEPASWAMMIAGFGLVGGAIRYRRGDTAIRFA